MTSETISPRDRCAALLESMSPRDIRQLAEYCIDHLNDPKEARTLSNYLRVAVVPMSVEPNGTRCPLCYERVQA